MCMVVVVVELSKMEEADASDRRTLFLRDH